MCAGSQVKTAGATGAVWAVQHWRSCVKSVLKINWLIIIWVSGVMRDTEVQIISRILSTDFINNPNSVINKTIRINDTTWLW